MSSVRKIKISAIALQSSLFAASVLASTFPSQAETWRIGLFAGQWADTRLPLLPYNTATGQLSFSESKLYSIVVSRHMLTTDLFFPGTTFGVSNAHIEFEGTASIHRGLQKHQEATLGIMLRSGDFDIASAGRLNVGWSNGVSWALKPPSYEYGSNFVRGQDTVQFQYYMGLELEYTPSSWDRVSLFARLHHRSGIYGLVSPSKTGSNIIGLGVRVRLGTGR